MEYFIRFTCAPRKLKFFVQPLNLVDLFAILPYIFSFVLDHLSEFHIIGKAGKVVRLVRVTRILRVFKLVRHFAGLQSLFATLKQAQRELGLLVMLVGVCVLTFSSLVYFSEKDEQNWTFLDSFWWGLLTITTVGYGKFFVITNSFLLYNCKNYSQISSMKTTSFNSIPKKHNPLLVLAEFLENLSR